MSRRLNPCTLCHDHYADQSDTKFPAKRGLTRHDDRVCSACRKHGAPSKAVSYRGRAA